MALATQCPHCYTSFRVANDQLKLHAGMVRCGACKQTFNGIEHLLAPGEPPRTPIPLTSQESPATTNTISDDTVESEKQNRVQVRHEAIGQQNPQIETGSSTISADDEAFIAKYIAEPHIANDSVAEPRAEMDNTNDAKDEAAVDELDFETEEFSLPPTNALEVPFEESLEEHVEGKLDEHQANQQELDDIALFQQKLASFAVQIEAPEVENVEHADDQLIAEHVTSHLEIIAQEDQQVDVEDGLVKSVSDDNEKSIAFNSASPSITASLDFELSDEERAWNDPAQVSKLEVQTQAAISDGDDSKYSKHETVFSEDTVPEDALEQDLQQLLAETKSSVATPPTFTAPRKLEPALPSEPVESTTDHNPDKSYDEDEHQPEFMIQAEKARRYGKLQLVAFCLGLVVLFLAGAGQSVYFFRSGIAAHFPQTKPWIQQMCQRLNCQVKLPTQIDAINFDSTELITLNQDPHVLSLALQLQNKSSMTQAWPMLELILKDSRGKTVLQRVFTPEEYLESKSQIAKGFNANSESNIKVHFELTTMKAAGYAVGVFYP